MSKKKKNIVYSKPYTIENGKVVFNLSYDEFNDDWIKHVNNSRENEEKIYQELKQRYQKKD